MIYCDSIGDTSEPKNLFGKIIVKTEIHIVEDERSQMKKNPLLSVLRGCWYIKKQHQDLLLHIHRVVENH